jgi:hypothetical protein
MLLTPKHTRIVFLSADPLLRVLQWEEGWAGALANFFILMEGRFGALQPPQPTKTYLTAKRV